jgi:hypothetical protein
MFLFWVITSLYDLRNVFIFPTANALYPFTSKNLILFMAYAISELIDTLVWESFSIFVRTSFNLSFYLGGNVKTESNSFPPTYSIKSWIIYPIIYKELHFISTLPYLDFTIISISSF